MEPTVGGEGWLLVMQHRHQDRECGKPPKKSVVKSNLSRLGGTVTAGVFFLSNLGMAGKNSQKQQHKKATLAGFKGKVGLPTYQMW